MRTSRPDPWQPLGNIIDRIALVAVTMAAPYRKVRPPLTRDYIEDPEPRWLYCQHCGHSTVWEPYRWVLDGGSLDWECTECGAVA